MDELKRKAAEQSQLLAEKQSEADHALGQITESMQVCICGISFENSPMQSTENFFSIKN